MEKPKFYHVSTKKESSNVLRNFNQKKNSRRIPQKNCFLKHFWKSPRIFGKAHLFFQKTLTFERFDSLEAKIPIQTLSSKNLPRLATLENEKKIGRTPFFILFFQKKRFRTFWEILCKNNIRLAFQKIIAFFSGFEKFEGFFYKKLIIFSKSNNTFELFENP